MKQKRSFQLVPQSFCAWFVSTPKHGELVITADREVHRLHIPERMTVVAETGDDVWEIIPYIKKEWSWWQDASCPDGLQVLRLAPQNPLAMRQHLRLVKFRPTSRMILFAKDGWYRVSKLRILFQHYRTASVSG